MSLPPLHEAWAEEVRSSLLGSTTARRQELAALLDRELATKAKQTAAGPASASKREDAMFAKLEKAAGALKPEFRGFRTALAKRIVANPQAYGFEQVPDPATIAKAQRRMHENRTTLASSTLCST